MLKEFTSQKFTAYQMSGNVWVTLVDNKAKLFQSFSEFIAWATIEGHKELESGKVRPKPDFFQLLTTTSNN